MANQLKIKVKPAHRDAGYSEVEKFPQDCSVSYLFTSRLACKRTLIRVLSKGRSTDPTEAVEHAKMRIARDCPPLSSNRSESVRQSVKRYLGLAKTARLLRAVHS